MDGIDVILEEKEVVKSATATQREEAALTTLLQLLKEGNQPSDRKLLFGGHILSKKVGNNNDTITAHFSRNDSLINMQLPISSADALKPDNNTNPANVPPQAQAVRSALESCEQSEIMIQFQPQNIADLVKLRDTIINLQALVTKLPEGKKPSFRIHIDRKKLTTDHKEDDSAFNKFFGLTSADRWLKGYIDQINKQEIHKESAPWITELIKFVKDDEGNQINQASSAHINISIKNKSPEPSQKKEPDDDFYNYLQELKKKKSTNGMTYSNTQNHLLRFSSDYSETATIGGENIQISTQRSKNNSLKSVTITHKETAAINKDLLKKAVGSFKTPKATINFKPTNIDNLNKLQQVIDSLAAKPNVQLDIHIDASELITSHPNPKHIQQCVNSLNEATNSQQASDALKNLTSPKEEEDDSLLTAMPSRSSSSSISSHNTAFEDLYLKEHDIPQENARTASAALMANGSLPPLAEMLRQQRNSSASSSSSSVKPPLIPAPISSGVHDARSLSPSPKLKQDLLGSVTPSATKRRSNSM